MNHDARLIGTLLTLSLVASVKVVCVRLHYLDLKNDCQTTVILSARSALEVARVAFSSSSAPAPPPPSAAPRIRGSTCWLNIRIEPALAVALAPRHGGLLHENTECSAAATMASSSARWAAEPGGHAPARRAYSSKNFATMTGGGDEVARRAAKDHLEYGGRSVRSHLVVDIDDSRDRRRLEDRAE